MVKKLGVALGVCVLVAGAVSPAMAATTPAQKCAAAKQKAAGKKASSKMGCYSKAKAKSLTVDPACLTKAEAKFSSAMAKAGAACPGTAPTIESLVDSCVSTLVADVPGDGKCPSSSAKAAGKAVSSELACTAKEITKPGSLAACHAKADGKLSSAISKAGACGQAGTLQADVHNCRDSISGALPPTTTTSTSSSTSSSTSTSSTSSTSTTSSTSSTTSTTTLCGNGVIDAGEQCDTGGSPCPAFAGTCQSDCTCPCDFLDPSVCMYPFPNDWFTTADGTKDTGKRINFSLGGMPKNVDNVIMDPVPYRGNDGFSQGASIITRVPNVDLAMTGAAPITDIERSLDAGAPVVLVNANTLAHHLMWVEIDSQGTTEADRAVFVRPAINLDEGGRYIVAMRDMKDPLGVVIPPNADFLAYRDNIPTGDPVKEKRRPHMESIFATLAAAGVPRANLYLAWDFTVASTRNTTERLLFARDDAFARLGSAAPTFSVTTVTNNFDAGRIYRHVVGTFQVERYVDSTSGSPPGARMQLDANGLPIHQATTQPANFDCIIPEAALANAGATAVPARASIYGHGLLGSASEVTAGNVRDMANEHNFVFCATDWIGMSSGDIFNAGAILQELGKFPSLADRLQQGMVDQLFLARLMIHPNGFTSDPAFKDSFGNPVIDTSAVFYDGNSQGGIFGGTIMAIAQDITRGVLGVPAMNYSTLLNRSVDFDSYFAILRPKYPNEIERPLLFALIQMLWDRSDPNGYARHIVNDPLPGTPSHQVLMHLAFGDHQVANVATEVEARTIGVSIHTPAIASGRHSDVNPYFGIPAIPSYPFNGSALIVWDSGSPTPPTTNTPPSAGTDPHSHPRSSVIGRNQKSAFLQTGGNVIDVCSGAPCVP